MPQPAGQNKHRAEAFLAWLLTHKSHVFDDHGFKAVKPVFYGPQDAFAPFAAFAEYGGQAE